MNLANAVLIPFILILVSVVVFRELRYVFRKRASEKWPTLHARIESVIVRSGRASIRPELKLTYAYFVDGIRHTGVFFLLAGDNRKWGEGIHQVLTGMNIAIRYDAHHPGISFLSDSQMMGKRVMQGPSWTFR
jgi:hypothetical protein